jgi:hypothetical protein
MTEGTAEKAGRKETAVEAFEIARLAEGISSRAALSVMNLKGLRDPPRCPSPQGRGNGGCDRRRRSAA